MREFSRYREGAFYAYTVDTVGKSYSSSREDAAIVEKVCSSKSRANTQTSLNKVPDYPFLLKIL